MNTFNRIVVILLLIVSVIVLPVALFALALMPEQMLNFGQQGLDFIGNHMTFFNIVITIIVGVLLLILCAFLLALEVRRARAKTIKVQKISGGEAEIAIDSIARRLEHHIEGVVDVLDVKPKITRKGKGVRVQLEVVTSPDIDVPMMTEEVCELARDIVEDRMGLKLSKKIKVHIKYPKEKEVWEGTPRGVRRPIPTPLPEMGEAISPPPIMEEEIFPAPSAPIAEAEEVAPPPPPPIEVEETAPVPPSPVEEEVVPAPQPSFEEELEELEERAPVPPSSVEEEVEEMTPLSFGEEVVEEPVPPPAGEEVEGMAPLSFEEEEEKGAEEESSDSPTAAGTEEKSWTFPFLSRE